MKNVLTKHFKHQHQSKSDNQRKREELSHQTAVEQKRFKGVRVCGRGEVYSLSCMSVVV